VAGLRQKGFLVEIDDFGKIYVGTEPKKPTAQRRLDNAELYGATLIGLYKKSIVFGGLK
jgi:hypothetical protein